jgi:hypothetical protein
MIPPTTLFAEALQGYYTPFWVLRLPLLLISLCLYAASYCIMRAIITRNEDL